MLSPRLSQIAAFIKKGSVVLDIGTDHAYLPIYLVKNNICPKVIASDVSKNALAQAQKNIEKYSALNIKLVLSDGLLNIQDKYDIITISGMGTSTIIDILKNQKLSDDLIISSNNNLYELRLFMNKLGYQIKEEKAILDHQKYYDIIYYHKGYENLSKRKLKYGISDNNKYYQYLLKKQLLIFKKVNIKRKIKMIYDLLFLAFRSI